MTNLRSFIGRSILTMGMMGVALGVGASPASAAVMTFEVNETVVPGAAPNSFDADSISFNYIEDVTFTGPTTFTANLVVNFTSYTLNGVDAPHQVGPEGTIIAQQYSLYAVVTFSGEFESGLDPNDANQTLFDFDPLSASVEVYLDPDSNKATADTLIMTANTIDASLSDGTVTTLTASGEVLVGEFRVTFTDAIAQGLGLTYWPDFNGLVLRANTTGDIDDTSVLTGQGGDITGQGSINFLAAPEPTSMALFGLALLGSGIAARRRRL